MKKEIAVLITAVLSVATVFTSTSCLFPTFSDPSETSSGDSTASESASSDNADADGADPEQELYNIGDTITIDNWQITVNTVEVTDKIPNDIYGTVETYFSPDEGSKYVVFNMSIKNLGTDSRTFLPVASLADTVRIKITYQSYEFTGTNLLGHSDDLHSSVLNPLSSRTGIFAFEIADEVVEDMSELRLVFSTKKESRVFRLEALQEEPDTTV